MECAAATLFWEDFLFLSADKQGVVYACKSFAIYQGHHHHRASSACQALLGYLHSTALLNAPLASSTRGDS